MALGRFMMITWAPAVLGLRSPRERGAPNKQAVSMLQTSDADADSVAHGWRRSPVERVVELLKSMGKKLDEELDHDQRLYKKLKCWCEDNAWNRGNEIEDSKAKIEELSADIESLTAKRGELTATIKEVKAKTADDKDDLAQAQAIRDKQLREFHGLELDNIQAIENLKAAIIVLGKHHDEGVFQQFAPVSLVQLSRREGSNEEDSWTQTHEAAHVAEPLDEFMRSNDYGSPDAAEQVSDMPLGSKFLQQYATAQTLVESALDGWFPEDVAIVRKAIKTVGIFVQARQEESYYPSYAAQSGEILGVLKQIKEEMEKETGDAQKLEASRADNFDKLRQAKVAEIKAGERMEEQKEDELAKTANALAEAKEDLGQEKAILEGNEAFLKNMKETCGNADKSFEERKKSRQAEMEAVAQTIEILSTDEAKDVAVGTYSLLQQGSTVHATASQKQARARAAARLRVAAMRTQNSELAMLATTVELDAFTKVKQAIEEMIDMMKKQEGDDIKKNDWCKAEFKENEMTTMKVEDRKADLEAKIAETESTIKKLQDEISAAKTTIDKEIISMQKAGLDRKEENSEYQKTIADQTITIDVLKKALNSLVKFYNSGSFLQTRQEPGSVVPVVQMEYKPSDGAAGVMQMLEKLIVEAERFMADAKKGEQSAQTGYEALISDTNAAIYALQKEVVTKTKAKAKKEKAKMQAESDLTSTVEELEGLAKYLQDLHAECDFLLKNFDTRQESRGAEVEDLQQALQILNGASFA